MKKTFLCVLFTAAIISSFSASAFAEDRQQAVNPNLSAPVITPLNHGVDY
ncbi:hypothetical protein M2104_000249 [Paenibacillus sp. PastH-2]|nr:hypothetical protein [Paenibacillus sp. PastH-2]